jgi:uncharacterized protein (DUF2236 family)
MPLGVLARDTWKLTRGRSHAERLASRDGYFAPESVIRRVGNTPLLPLLGGGPVALLQAAHPLIVAAVVDHSDYRNTWQRLHRTLQGLYLIAYGSREEADRAAAAIRRIHGQVRGRTAEPLGPFPAGTPYDANDPDLLVWVHAGLTEIALAVHNRFVERLSPDEEEQFYRDMAAVAELVGTPASVIPPDRAACRSYFETQLASPVICVTPPAREVAAALYAAPLPLPLRVMLPTYRLAMAGLLPPRLRSEYGFSFGLAREAALAVGARGLRAVATPAFRAAQWLAPPAPAGA